MKETAQVLIVDDERPILTSISRVLFDEDYEVHLAQTSIEALMALEKRPIDVVVSDYQLANTNGVELLQLISQKWPEVTRITLTGYTSDHIARESMNKAGVFKFITKPWDNDELKHIISSAIKRTKMIRQNIKLLDEIQEKNTKIEAVTNEIETRLKLKDKKIMKRKESVMSFQVQINAVNELLTKISSGKNLRELVVAILDGLKTVVNNDYSCILSTNRGSKDFNIYHH